MFSVRIGHIADPLGSWSSWINTLAGSLGSASTPEPSSGVALCRMFHRAIRWQPWMPKYLSSDHDPLYRFGQWQANLRIPGGDRNQDRSLCSPVPSLCGTADRHDSTRVFGSHVVLDHGRTWRNKLLDFQDYYNHHRTHSARAGCTPQETSGPKVPLSFGFYRWRRHCGGLYQTPIAA